MQWNAAPQRRLQRRHEPWLPLADDFAAVNVAAQRDDPTSMLTLYRALIELRRREPALAVGDYARDRVPGARARLSRGHAATGVS